MVRTGHGRGRRRSYPVTVLALHGFLGSGADWHAVASRLEATVVAPDLAGHGAAVGLDPAAYPPDGAAHRLADALEARGVRRALVAGYSMGGRLALHFALRHPDRVGALLLLSASPGLRTAAARADRRALDAERAAAIARDLPAFLDAWYRADLWGGLEVATRRGLVERRSRNDAAELGRSLEGMGTGAQPSHWDRLREIGVPAVAAAGARDARYVAIAHEMAAVSSVRPVVIPDAGHALLTEAPASVARLLTALLSTLDG